MVGPGRLAFQKRKPTLLCCSEAQTEPYAEDAPEPRLIYPRPQDTAWGTHTSWVAVRAETREGERVDP